MFPTGDDLIALFWDAKVPGSGAPEIPYVEMVESMANRGRDMTEAEELLPRGMELARKKDRDGLRALTSRLVAAVNDAPRDPASPYWTFQHPESWEETVRAMEAGAKLRDEAAMEGLEDKVLAGWRGQLAGGAFGTAIEGYHSDRIAEVYGRIDRYVTEPETVNDDVVYELVFLDVFERMGRRITSPDIGLEWVRQIPFGWSAEWVALHNMGDGILPPLSGSWRNPYSEWIGAQMRGMVCGMLAPGWPMEAARLAYTDAVVSHAANGVYGEIYAAVLTSLAFVRTDARLLLNEAARYLPRKSEYAAIVRECLEVTGRETDPRAAWRILDTRFERYNWIHAYPNIAADILALWFGGGDMTRSFQLLAHAGLDVDCNAGLVGNVLGVMGGVPDQWAAPIGDKLETYLKGKEILSIRELARRTARLGPGSVRYEKDALPFYASARQTLDQVALQNQRENHGRKGRHDAARGHHSIVDFVPLGELGNRDGDGCRLIGRGEDEGVEELVPRHENAQEDGRDDPRHGNGDHDAQQCRKTPRPVDHRRFLQLFRHRVDESLHDPRQEGNEERRYTMTVPTRYSQVNLAQRDIEGKQDGNRRHHVRGRASRTGQPNGLGRGKRDRL